MLTLGNLGYVLIEEKNYSEAEKVLREALAGLRRVLGPSHEVTAAAANKLALVLALEGKRDEAFVNLRAYAEAFSSIDDIERLEKDDRLPISAWRPALRRAPRRHTPAHRRGAKAAGDQIDRASFIPPRDSREYDT